MARARGHDAHPGRLVVLEGIDGSGKSTIARALVDHLEAAGVDVKATVEPTETAIGQLVRQALADPDHDPVSEALLFAADHAAHVARLRGDLAEGRTVVSDRYSYSCLAYQAATLSPGWDDRQGESPLGWLEAVLAPFELEPDLVLLLDLPVDEAMDRVDGRARETEKFEERAFLEQVRANYLQLAEDHGFERVDASGRPEAVLAACTDAVDDLLDEVVA